MTGIIAYSIVFYLLAGIGSSIAYHRVLAHKSVKMLPWFEKVIVCIGLPAGTPIQWVGNHRAHHGFTDQIGDPHSPHLSGFWYAHCGWYINSKSPVVCIAYALGGPLRTIFDAYWRPRTNQKFNHLATDIADNSFYNWLSKPTVYQFALLLHLSIILSSAVLFFGASGLLLVWILLVLIYNLGDSIDSVGHLYGAKIGKSESRNNIVLGYLCFGDGWHANHHNSPTLAKHGNKFHQIDLSFIMLKIFKQMGIVKKLVKYEKQ